ncbi:MAG TPA: PadR family transcriptional regulator [Acidimicrobiia bacterium]|nr:PadR family transcriptional regulator [Acidimicrobiia bacterium]
MRDFRDQGRGFRGHRHGGEGWEGRGGWEGGRRAGRMRRGDIRTALLAILVEEPGHGYDVIQRLEEKTGGVWRPSPGSVYPTLQLLEDEGLVRSVERDGKRVYEVTPQGREEATRRIEEAGGTPWELAARADGGMGEFRTTVRQLFTAAKQVRESGNQQQVERMLEILKQARKELYTMLAES